MSAYINGNLAVEPRTVQKPKQQTEKKVVIRKKSLPVQEKLLYLFTVIVCVVVAGAIIWRYAQIYEMNARIQQIESQIHALQIENNKLKLEITKYQDPKKLLDQARSLGLMPNDGLNQVTLKDEQLTGALAMKNE